MNKVLSILACALIFLIPSYVSADVLTLEQAQEAACRITSRDCGWFPRTRGSGGLSVGSGTVVRQNNGRYYILTNGHVIERKEGRGAEVEFFSNGYVSKKIPAQIDFVYYYPHSSIDVAIISIPDNVFSNTDHKPRVIPIAPANQMLSTEPIIFGAGCPSGRWCQMWEAHLTKIKSYVLEFNMPPQEGQSGSGILTNMTIGDQTYTVLVGLVAWRYDINGMSSGGGVSYNRVLEILHGNPQPDRILANWRITSSEVLNDLHHVCDRCGKDKCEHYGIYDNNTHDFLRADNHKAFYWCPNVKPDREPTKTQQWVKYGEVPIGCPGGNCPWGYYPPQQPFNDPGQQPSPQLPFKEGPPDIISPWPDNIDNTKPAQPPVVPSPAPIVPPKPAPVVPQPPAVVPPPPEPIPAVPPTSDLQNKINDLQNTLKQVQTDNSNLSKSNADTTKQLNDAKTETDGVKQTLAQKIAAFIKIETENKALQQKVADFATAKAPELDNFNIPYLSTWLKNTFGVGFGTTLAIILSSLASGTFLTTLWHNYLYPWCVKRFGYFPSKIIDAIGRRTLSKYIAQKKTKNLSDKTDAQVYNNVETTNIDVKVSTGGHIEDLFAHGGGKLNGITPQDWAIKSGLYKTAVDKLKSGELVTQAGGQIFNCTQAANSIESYVTNQFFMKIKLPDIDLQGTLLHQAYLGYLYWQGVQKLRNGEFQILNYVEAADAIETWVQTEFRKMVS